jgi:two-component system, NarL family, sensor kinase
MQPSTTQITTLIIASSIFILLLILFVIAMIYKYKKRQQRYEEDLLTARLEVQEQTMQHIARELHDNIGARLTRSKLTLTTLTYHQPDVASSNVAGCVEELTTVIDDLRTLGHSLDGDYIAANGLVSALEQELDRTQKSGRIQAVLQIEGDVPVLPDATELFIFRIVQEAIQNVLKHAMARNLTVAVQYTMPTLTLTITDNGRGMKTEKEKEQEKEKEPKKEAEPKKEKGMGLINMKRRAALIGGQLHIQPAPGGGTTIVVTIIT